MEDPRIVRIEEKLDKVADHIGSINTTLGKQQVTLDEHIRRTKLLEDRVEPVEKRMTMIQGGLKLLGFLAAAAAVLESVTIILHGLH